MLSYKTHAFGGSSSISSNYYCDSGLYSHQSHRTYSHCEVGREQLYRSVHESNYLSSNPSPRGEDAEYFSNKLCTSAYRQHYLDRLRTMEPGRESPSVNSSSSSSSNKGACPCTGNENFTRNSTINSPLSHACRTDGAGGRMLMREWLLKQIHRGDVPGLEWMNEQNGLVRIPWRHGSRSGWHEDSDALLYRRWAIHTGKYTEGKEKRPKRWKANFRCALNSLPDVKELKEKTNKRGPQAFKVYQFQKPKQRRSQTRGRYCFRSDVPSAQLQKSAVCVKQEDQPMDDCQYGKTPDMLPKSESASSCDDHDDDQWTVAPSCQLDNDGRPLLQDLLDENTTRSITHQIPYNPSTSCHGIQPYCQKPSPTTTAELAAPVPSHDARMSRKTPAARSLPPSHSEVKVTVSIRHNSNYPLCVPTPVLSEAHEQQCCKSQLTTLHSVLPPVKENNKVLKERQMEKPEDEGKLTVQETSKVDERMSNQNRSCTLQGQQRLHHPHPHPPHHHPQQHHHLTSVAGTVDHLHSAASYHQNPEVAGNGKLLNLHHPQPPHPHPHPHHHQQQQQQQQQLQQQHQQFQISSRTADIGRSGSCSPGSEYSHSSSEEEAIDVSLEQIEPSRLDWSVDINQYERHDGWFACHNFEPMEGMATVAT